MGKFRIKRADSYANALNHRIKCASRLAKRSKTFENIQKYSKTCKKLVQISKSKRFLSTFFCTPLRELFETSNSQF